MCRPVTCRACRKVTWAGCGAHVRQVMAGVAPDDRCRCTDAERAAARKVSLLGRLLGR